MMPCSKTQSPGPKLRNDPLRLSRFTFHVSRITPGASGHSSPATRHPSRLHAFTLIEIMVVVGIMLVIMGMSIPFAKQVSNREALAQAVRDIEEVCGSARKRAIFQGSIAQLVFRAKDNTLSVEGASPDAGQALGGPAASGQSATISDKVAFKVFKVNGLDCLETEEAHVRFFPNGTSDDMIIVLFRPDKHEQYELYLEVTTGLVYIESDPSKFRIKS